MATNAKVEVELVDDKVGAVNDTHGVADAADDDPVDDDPRIKIVEIGGGKS